MRMFPVLYTLGYYGIAPNRVPPGAPASVPWDMLDAHEAQALRNHAQSLARLAERGGLSPQEMLQILDDKGWGGCLLATHAAIAELNRRVAAWLSQPR